MTDESAPHLSAATLSSALAALLQQTPDLILLAGPDGLLLAASAVAADLFGPAAVAPGADVRRLLGLAPGAPLAGEIALPGRRSTTLVAVPIAAEGAGRPATLLRAEVAPAPADEGRRQQQEQRLREVTLAISSALDIDEILDRVVRLSIDLLDADAGSLPLYDAAHDTLLTIYMVNIASASQMHYRGRGAIWSVIDSGQSYRNNRYASDPRAITSLVDDGVHAVLGVPVAAGGQILGVLNVYHRTPGRQFSARDQELLEIVGRQTGVAIQNARLYAAALRDADRRMLLYKAGASFGAALAPRDLYAAIHRAASGLVACDSFAIGLLDGERREIDYVYLADAGRLYPPERTPLSRGLLGFVLRTGVSLRLSNCDDEVDALFAAEDFGDSGNVSRSILAVVLTVAERTIGAITVQSQRPDAYDAADLDVMETLAATAAIAIQNAQLFARIHELATRDPLTGVFNRRHFFALARVELERSARYRHPLSMLMLDADHFKQINDTHGHLIGDAVLQAIATRCRACLREVDVVARYGGEEFLVMLPETGLAAALQAAARVHEVVGREPVQTEAGPVPVTVSIGVASYERDQIGGVDQLLGHVDHALYEAKHAGRNQIRAYRGAGRGAE